MEQLHFNGVVVPTGQAVDLWVVGGRVTFSPVAGARTVVRGAFFVPGLVDAHCHIGLGVEGAVDEATARAQAWDDLSAGVMLVRDCGQPGDTSFLDGDPRAPRIVRAGRHIARSRRYIRHAAHEIEPDELVAVMAAEARPGEWVKLVGDWIERGAGDLAPSFPAAAVREGIAAAHEAGARVTAHCFAEQSVAEIVEAGADCIEHGTGLEAETIALMAERGVALVPTMVNLANFPTYAAQGQTKFPKYAQHMLDLHARRYDTIGRARDAGVPIYAGTDAGTVVRHGRIVDEVLELAKVGGAEFALGAASWRAREWLGAEGIVEGASADFLIFEHDPLKDLNVLFSPVHLFLRGESIHD